jgi:hypothetical protein
MFPMFNFSSSSIQALVIPSVGFEVWAAPLIAHCRRSGIKTIFVPDNWDNVTSKNSISVMPDMIATMGEAMSASLVENLGVPRAVARAVGLPKFSTITRRLSRQETGPMSLIYLGFSVPYLEIATINALYEILSQKSDFSFKFYYKPHPAQLPRVVSDEIISPRIKVISQPPHTHYRLPVIDEDYTNFLSNFDLVIAPPTTMALEFLLAGRAQVVLDLSDDKIHRTTPSLFSRNFIHVRDLDRLELEKGTAPKDIADAISSNSNLIACVNRGILVDEARNASGSALEGEILNWLINVKGTSEASASPVTTTFANGILQEGFATSKGVGIRIGVVFFDTTSLF